MALSSSFANVLQALSSAGDAEAERYQVAGGVNGTLRTIAQFKQISNNFEIAKMNHSANIMKSEVLSQEIDARIQIEKMQSESKIRDNRNRVAIEKLRLEGKDKDFRIQLAGNLKENSSLRILGAALSTDAQYSNLKSYADESAHSVMKQFGVKINPTAEDIQGNLNAYIGAASVIGRNFSDSTEGLTFYTNVMNKAQAISFPATNPDGSPSAVTLEDVMKGAMRGEFNEEISFLKHEEHKDMLKRGMSGQPFRLLDKAIKSGSPKGSGNSVADLALKTGFLQGEIEYASTEVTPIFHESIGKDVIDTFPTIESDPYAMSLANALHENRNDPSVPTDSRKTVMDWIENSAKHLPPPKDPNETQYKVNKIVDFYGNTMTGRSTVPPVGSQNADKELIMRALKANGPQGTDKVKSEIGFAMGAVNLQP